MNLFLLRSFLIIICLGLGFKASYSQISGRVITDKQEPIANATILLEGTKIGTSTDSLGYFELDNKNQGSKSISVRAVGFQNAKKAIQPGAHESLNIILYEDNLNLNEVVVSASRYGMERKKAPVIVNVLSPKLFTATQSVAMSETLNYQPGVRVENNCQNCGFTQVRLNGMEGAYSQILINSRSVFSALNSVYGLDQIPTSMIDRIEVVRSGGSALFGANAIAGTINIITKDPVENDWQIKSTNSIIDGQAWDNTIDFNTSYVDNDLKTGATFYGMHRNRQAYDANGDGFTEMTKLKNLTFGTKAFYKPSEFNKITLDLSALNEFRRGGDNLDKAPHFTDVTEQLRTNTFIGGLTYDQYSKNYKHKLSIYGSAQFTDRESFYGGLGGGRSAQDSLLASNSYGETDDFAMVAGAQYTYTFERDVITAGVEYNNNRTKDNIPGYERIIDQKTHGVGTYTQYEWNILENLKTLIGARYDYTYVDGNYKLAGYNRKSSQNFGTFSPRFTLLYDITDYLQFRGGYARGFRAPQAFNEDMHVTSIGGQQVFVLIGENLETEYSNAYTGSLNFTKGFGPIQTSLLVEGFYTDLQNPFTNIMTSQDENLIIQEMRNGTGAKVYGSNIELNIAPSAKYTFQVGGTIQRSEFNDDQLLYEGATPAENISSRRFVRTPNVYGYLNANWKPLEPFSVDVTGVYTGSMIVPHVLEGEEMILKTSPDFFEANFRLGYTFSLKKELSLEVFGGMQNVFNAFQKDFDRGALRDSNYIYGPSRPRTITFGIKIGHFH